MAVLPEESTTEMLLREYDSLASNRGTWENHWEQVALKVLPYYAGTFVGSTSPGQKKGFEQFDITATSALWKFSAAMESMLTPASGRWHKMRPVIPELKKDRSVMDWFEQVTDAMFHYRYSPHSGFQANMHDVYVSVGAFGTGAVFVDAFQDPTRPGVKGLRYRHVHLGELFLATNHQGQVDKVYRRFRMTLRQVAQKWGADKLPDGLKERLKTKPEDEVTLVHAVRPNSKFEPGRLDVKGKRFSSHYVLKDQKEMMDPGGYRCMPYAVARYLTAPGEIYGRGPAMNVLPAINVLNEEKKILLKQGHRTVDPILLVHDDGVLDGVSLRPGSTIGGGMSAEGRALVGTLPVGNVAVGKDMMDDERMAINDAFLVTLFQILVETPQMTATEVLERAREKGALLSPTMGRFQAECLGPMIEREFDLLLSQGLIPPPPPLLIEAGGEYQVEYDAPLNRAMRAEEAAGGMRSFQWASEIATNLQDPSILDPFDTDVMIPELADINAMPTRWLRTPEAIAARRAKRDQEAAVAQMTQALPGMAAMAKVASPEGTSMSPGQPA